MKTGIEQQAQTKIANDTILRTSNKKTETQAINLEDKMELERREAYIEPRTREILRELVQCEDQAEIIPKYSPNSGFLYQLPQRASDASQLNNNISTEFLGNLARLDILHKEFYDSVSVCPFCQSTIITIHNRCPRCKGHNIDKTSLTEHIPCGFIDQRNKYINNLCPKCGGLLIEGQYRNMGRWYVCRECGERFENPESDLVCRSCNKNFTIKEAQVLEIPKFSLNQLRKKEIRQNVASLENVRNLLIDLGFNVEMPGLVQGQKSGMKHHFSLIAKKQIQGQETNIALDHAISESEVSASPLILFIYKLSEVKVDIPIFVAMPALNDTAKKIAQGHEILLVEGLTEEKEAIEKIKKDIEFRIQMKKREAEVAQKKNAQKSESSLLGKLTGFRKK